MPSTVDYFTTGDQATARSAVFAGLTAEGFRITEQADGSATAERGSLGMTIAFGAMAGKNFHLKFLVSFFTAPDGALVVRLSRDATMGAIKGGAIGLSLTTSAFDRTAAALHASLAGAGVLSSAVQA